MTAVPASLEGGQLACRTLEALGITHVFGLPGTQTVAFYEALRRSALTSVVPTNELSASFMAGAFYRACGRPAVLSTIPGPGFTYALTGLAEARLDSAALIHLTVAAPDGRDARFRLQAIEQRRLGEVLTKGVFTVERVADLEAVLRAAHTLALQGEPGPVIVELADHARAQVWRGPATQNLQPVPQAEFERLWQRLQQARRPLIYAGQGALASAMPLRRLIEQLRAPLMTTPSARGLLPESHPLVMAFDPCRGGLGTVHELFGEADMILVLGAKLGHNGSAGRGLPFDAARTVQIDAEPSVGGQSYPMAEAVVGRVEDWFDIVSWNSLTTSDWPAEILEAIKRRLRHPSQSPAEPIIGGATPADFFGAMRSALPAEVRLVTDTGLHQILARRHYDVEAPRGLLLPSDFQSMGFGLPAAIAAKLACPELPVVALVGDGSLLINGGELAVAARMKLQLPVIVFNDGALNQIRGQQHADFGTASGTTLPAVDWQAYAAALHVAYHRCAHVDDILTSDAFVLNGPMLIDVPVGDSPKLKRQQFTARAKNITRQAIGPRLIGAARKLLRRSN